jgi:hypothetical protein
MRAAIIREDRQDKGGIHTFVHSNVSRGRTTIQKCRRPEMKIAHNSCLSSFMCYCRQPVRPKNCVCEVISVPGRATIFLTAGSQKRLIQLKRCRGKKDRSRGPKPETEISNDYSQTGGKSADVSSNQIGIGNQITNRRILAK